ncbi:exosome complex component RRP45 [Kwoniella heveanensis CBS 569]|uniref:Exosome complex component RRP45 n=1 Tax=Kwoniella heveanensis BCC8398 TaxID=1296120 RepID=A0A1B9GXX6_9TREE|nr:exosome complex component RRP45 [Kwoniella heveanensis BCC8398]OCF45523.1 exosome complex component RRP45 [Kwoniella heveanensis CBS 569]
MVREVDPPSIQKEFLLQALAEGKRLDGRITLEQREVNFVFGEELGCVECRLGKTAVLAQVSASIVKPRDDRPYEGFLLINSEIGPMASSVYESGRSSDDEILITRLLEKSIRRTEAIDREALCILAGEKVWQLRLTLHFLSDSGNLLDCASLAAMAALKHFRKPEVEVIGDEVIIHSPDERAPVPLAIHHTPLCLTFAYYENLPPILDPTHLESTLCSGTLTLTLNAQREICVLSKAGGTPLAASEIMGVVNVGVDRVREMVKHLEEALERDREGRVVEVR